MLYSKTRLNSVVRFMALVSFFALGALGNLRASSASFVDYLPSLKPVEGLLPINYSYDLLIASPDNVPVGVYPISFRVQVNNKPLGVSDETAISYVKFNPTTPTFAVTALGRVVVSQVSVRVQIPASAVAGNYGYQVYTEGWPNGIDFSDAGTAINVTATRADVPPPPTVNIDDPADGTTYTVPAASMPKLVNVKITAGAAEAAPITNIVADVNGVSIALAQTGLGKPHATGTATLSVSQPGTYTITAKSFNPVGDATDVNTFTVKVTAPPPTVKINTPTPNSTYTYTAGGPALVVPFTFTAKSNFGGIRTLTAKVDGQNVAFTPSGIGTLTATGTINLPYTAAGSHTLQVTTADDYGTATDNSNFTITAVTPTPAIVITNPANNITFNLAPGATTMNIPFTFKTTSNNGFVVDSVSATLDGRPTAIASTTGLGTASATSNGTLPNVAAGTHTLTANGTSAGIPVTTSVTFTVKGSSVPPSVVINTPSAGSTYSRTSNGPALTIPLTFTGTSNTPGGVITKLTATLDGKSLAVSPSNLNSKVATGSATMTVSTAGTHTIAVTATDAYGTASATRTFTVTIVQGKNVCGRVFFDVNFNGVFDLGSSGGGDDWGYNCRDTRDWDDCRGSRYDSRWDRGNCRDSDDRYNRRDDDDDGGEDFGLAGVTVKLLNSAKQVVATVVSDADGTYCFSNIAPGAYTVSAVEPAGMDSTTAKDRSVTVSSKNVCVRDIGFGLEFREIRNLCANGKNSSFWYTQLDKACRGDRRDVQVSESTCNNHTRTIKNLSLSVFDDLTLKNACSKLNSRSTSSRDQLTKELCAAEYNYANGAHINGNRTLTYCFIQWGERVLNNPSRYSDSYRRFACDWFKAYNASNGGRVYGPNSN